MAPAIWITWEDYNGNEKEWFDIGETMVLHVQWWEAECCPGCIVLAWNPAGDEIIHQQVNDPAGHFEYYWEIVAEQYGQYGAYAGICVDCCVTPPPIWDCCQSLEKTKYVNVGQSGGTMGNVWFNHKEPCAVQSNQGDCEEFCGCYWDNNQCWRVEAHETPAQQDKAIMNWCTLSIPGQPHYLRANFQWVNAIHFPYDPYVARCTFFDPDWQMRAEYTSSQSSGNYQKSITIDKIGEWSANLSLWDGVSEKYITQTFNVVNLCDEASTYPGGPSETLCRRPGNYYPQYACTWCSGNSKPCTDTAPICENRSLQECCLQDGQCKWWSDNTCHSDREPCETWKNPADCYSHGCHWWFFRDECHHDAPGSGESQPAQPAPQQPAPQPQQPAPQQPAPQQPARSQPIQRSMNGQPVENSTVPRETLYY